MKSNYEIVKYEPKFKSQLVKLQSHLWGPDIETNIAYLEWKYERNPYIEDVPIFLALCNGDVVGMRGLHGARWEIGDGHSFLGLCAGDLVIEPNHRNCGLYTRIMSYAIRHLEVSDFPYIFSFSASPIAWMSSLTMGWRSIGSVQNVARESKTEAILSRFERHLRKHPALFSMAQTGVKLARGALLQSRSPYTKAFRAFDRNAARKNRDCISVESTPRATAMAELVSRIGNNGRIRHVRDAGFFAWRFQNPLCHYRFLYWEGTKMEGFLVLGASNRRSRVNIVDWEATNAQVRADLLEAVVQWGSFAALNTWSATLSVDAMELLADNGFREVMQNPSLPNFRPGVLVKPLCDNDQNTEWNLDGRRLLDLTDWDLRMIYSDFY